MSINDKYTSLKTMLMYWYQNLVNEGESVTEESAIENAINLNTLLGYNLDMSELRRAVDDLMLTGIITQENGVDVVDEDSRHMNWFEKWVQNEPDTRQRRWALYRGLLMQRGWQDNVLNALDKDTSRTVDLMGNPETPGPWERYGLVIGEVQSGKTANYIGVLNKALDAGYKMIVVLGGHTDDLRKQTQKRIDSDLIGYDSSFYRTNINLEGAAFQKGFIGFGKELKQYGVGTQAITTVDSDFKADSRAASMGQTLTGDPRIAVIKKNKAIINNLTAFLRGREGVIDLPLAIIDDEADWASVNTKTETDKTAINKAIRDLLSVSSRSTYLAITATPFANVFIDHTNQNDLFPRNYIRALKAPSNYRGVESYMTADARNDNPHTLQTQVEDVLSSLPYKHKIDATIQELPESLKTAIYAFILATSVRRTRGDQNKPSSMMVNISRFNAVQARIQTAIEAFVNGLRDEVRFAELDDNEISPAINELQHAFSMVYPDLSDISFDVLIPHIKRVLEETLVELVNSNTVKKRQKDIDALSREEREIYENKPKIFIGGNILARGLTLEGLIVSYYLRKTAAADTLLQMGRWFGYRPRYEDLVRIWTAEEIIDLFDYAAEISASLRREIGRMNDMGLTPEQFGLAIQQHPESFKITALNKSRSAADIPADIRLSGHVFESDKLSTKHKVTASNLAAVNKLVDALIAEADNPATCGSANRNHIWRGIDESLVQDFLHIFSAHEADPFFGSRASDSVQRIADSLDSNESTDKWNVVLVSGRGKVAHPMGSNTIVDVYPSIRNAIEIDENRNVLRFGNRRVAAGNDLFNSLTAEQIHQLKALPESEGKRTFSQQYVVDNSLVNPTLMIYIATSETGTDVNGVDMPTMPNVAVSLAFPHDDGSRRSTNQRVVHVLANTVYQQMLRDDQNLSEEDDFEEKI